MLSRARAVLFLSFLLLAPAVFATTAIELSDFDLTEQAELITVGTVTGSQSQWVGRNLVTVVSVSVSEVLKGSAGSAITVVLPGGVDANRRFPIAMSYPGAPQMGAGEQVVLFLVGDDMIAGTYAIAGFSQGKYTITGDSAAQQVTRDLQGMQLARGTQLQGGGRTVASYAEFAAKIRSYVKAIDSRERR
jgi:hypothetical protein